MLLCSNPCNAFPGHSKQTPKSCRSGPASLWPRVPGLPRSGLTHAGAGLLRGHHTHLPGSPGFLRSSRQRYLREPPAPPALFKSPPLLFLSATALSNMTHTTAGVTISSLPPQRERRLPGPRPSHLPSFTALPLASRRLDTSRRCVQGCVQGCGPLSL